MSGRNTQLHPFRPRLGRPVIPISSTQRCSGMSKWRRSMARRSHLSERAAEGVSFERLLVLRVSTGLLQASALTAR